MHELPMTQSILDIALRHADGKHVTDIYLVMGELSKLVDESIQFYWDIIAKDTNAAGARLHFRRVPAQFQCMVCFQKYHPTGEEFSCPYCRSVGAKVVAGEEFFMEAIDVEDKTVAE